MKIVLTIVVGFIVVIAAIFFLGCSICAFAPEMPGQARVIAVVFALVGLGVMIGGVSIIAAIHKRPEEPKESL